MKREFLTLLLLICIFANTSAQVKQDCDGIEYDNIAELVVAENILCNSVELADVLFINPNGTDPIIYDEILVSPMPDELQIAEVSGGMLLLIGFPVGTYCVEFIQFTDDGCTIMDEECFEIEWSTSGIFEIDEFIAFDLTCDYTDSPGGYLEVYFENSIVNLSEVEISVTETNTEEQVFLDWSNAVDDENILAFGEFEFGSYSFQISDPNSNCSVAFEYDFNSSLFPEPEYELVVIEPTDENDQNGIIQINQIEGTNDTEWFYLLEFSSDSLQVGETIPGVWTGNYTLSTSNGACTYEIDIFVPPSSAFGCTDPLACNYSADASIDDNSCDYPEYCGDLTGDGEIDTGDLLLILGQLGCLGADCAGDFNGDGVVNLFDILIFLGLM